MSGACGTAMLWWWDNYVDAHDLYYHFGAVARFVRDIPWTTAGFRPLDASATSPRLRVVGLRGKPITIAWLQNKDHTWWNAVSGQEARPLDAEVSLRGFPDGRYEVQWWDTWRGRPARTETAQARGGTLRLRVEKLRRDVAVKIRPR